MTGAILELRYKHAGDRALNARITGCFFFVTENTIATSHHLLNTKNMGAKPPYKHARFFLLFDNTHAELTGEEKFYEFPDSDITLIQFKESFKAEPVKLSYRIPERETPVQNESYVNTPPIRLNFKWENGKIVLEGYNITHMLREYSGEVTQRMLLDETNVITTDEVKFKQAKAFGLSYGAEKGVSGAALFLTGTNKVAGIIAGGETDKKDSHHLKRVFAISSLEIMLAMKKSGLLPQWWKFWQKSWWKF